VRCKSGGKKRFCDIYEMHENWNEAGMHCGLQAYTRPCIFIFTVQFTSIDKLEIIQQQRGEREEVERREQEGGRENIGWASKIMFHRKYCGAGIYWKMLASTAHEISNTSLYFPKQLYNELRSKRAIRLFPPGAPKCR
jgi:hypothetical protein